VPAPVGIDAECRLDAPTTLHGIHAAVRQGDENPTVVDRCRTPRRARKELPATSRRIVSSVRLGCS
jgi:hypothetical protein